jgi:hypothetical protein
VAQAAEDECVFRLQAQRGAEIVEGLMVDSHVLENGAEVAKIIDRIRVQQHRVLKRRASALQTSNN